MTEAVSKHPSHLCMIDHQTTARGELAPLPWKAWVTRAGWSERKQRFLASVKSIYTLAKLRKHLKPWGLPQFKVRPCSVCYLHCQLLPRGRWAGILQGLAHWQQCP